MIKKEIKTVSYTRLSSPKHNVTEVIVLSNKINDLLTEHYDKSWSMRNKRCTDYLSLNDDFIKKVKEVFKLYESARKAELKIIKEKYGNKHK